MRLEHLTLDVRPRPDWQAIDLGMVLLRRHWKLMYAAWWSVWLPLALVFGLIPTLAGAGWSSALLWFCKPLVERLLTFILGRAVFAATPTLRETLRAWPSQLRHGLVGGLTWRRLTQPGRAYFVPVLQLEGQSGKAARQRWRVLAAHGAGGSARGFAHFCACFESLIVINTVVLIGLFTPDIGSMNPFRYLTMGRDGQELLQILSYVGYVIAGGVIGPWYVASCFALYLNRRSTLEGWDLELGLRQMQARLQAPASSAARKAGVMVMLAVLCLAFSAAPRQAWAAPKPVVENASRPAAASPEQAALRAKVDGVLDGPDFHHWRTDRNWVFKPDASSPQQENPDEKPRRIPISEALASALKWTVVSLAVLVFLVLLYRYRTLFEGLVLPRKKEQSAPLPTHVAGMEIAPESLPADVAAQVRALWRAGQQRPALALLYRATLAALVQRYALALKASYTEADCLAAANQALAPDARSGFAHITAAWQAGAWGDRWPAQVDDLCALWQRHFTLGEAA